MHAALLHKVDAMRALIDAGATDDATFPVSLLLERMNAHIIDANHVCFRAVG